MNRVPHFALTLLVALTGSWVPVQAAPALVPDAVEPEPAKPATDLCEAGESPVFSCSMKEGRLLSVCRTDELTRNTGSLRYRFGRTGQVELEFPETAGLGTAPFLWHRYTGGVTTQLGLSFQRSDVWYTVFMHSSCDHSSGECGEAWGVQINRNHPIPPILLCLGPPTNDDFWDLEGLVPHSETSHYAY